ncbi:Zinc finger C2H2-type [Trinorchestia longiramus]|nr:Zinc finger C2H2-type [Trinorchestia longiramus]
MFTSVTGSIVPYTGTYLVRDTPGPRYDVTIMSGAHLHSPTCTVPPAQSHLHSRTCTVAPAQSHLHRRTCTGADVGTGGSEDIQVCVDTAITAQATLLSLIHFMMVVSGDNYKHKIFGFVEDLSIRSDSNMASFPREALTPPGSSPVYPNTSLSPSSSPASPTGPPTPDSVHTTPIGNNLSSPNATLQTLYENSSHPLNSPSGNPASSAARVVCSRQSPAPHSAHEQGSASCVSPAATIACSRHSSSALLNDSSSSSATKLVCSRHSCGPRTNGSDASEEWVEPLNCEQPAAVTTSAGESHGLQRKDDEFFSGNEEIMLPLSASSDVFPPHLPSIVTMCKNLECGEEGLACSVCRRSFLSQQDFTRHIRSHNRVIDLSDGSRMFECGVCGKQLSSNSSLDRHLLVHSGERPFRCYICGTHFTTNGNMHRHIRGHYRSGGGSDTGDSDGGSDNGMNSCRKRRGEMSEGPEPKLPKLCESDNEDADRPQSPGSREHDVDFRRISPLRTVEERPCEICPERLSSVQEWILHMREHAPRTVTLQTLPNREHSHHGLSFHPPSRDFTLTSIPPPSLIPPSSSMHSDLSHDEQFTRDYRDMKLNGQYPCRLCKEVFSNLRKLKSHNLVHMNNPPYRCNLCSFYSNDKNALKEHMKGHKGDTPYECRLCGLAFTTKANCERHIKNIHSKQTRDEIKECMSYNAQEDGVESFERSVEAICQICKIDCKSRSVLRDHMRSSHPDGVDKPYSCRICRYTFLNQTDGVRHVVQAHPEAVSSGTLSDFVERRTVNERTNDLSSVESLLTISKIPISLAPARSQPQPDHVTITPTVSHLPSVPSVLPRALHPIVSPEPLISPLFSLRHSLTTDSAVEDAPLDLSMNKRLSNAHSNNESLSSNTQTPEEGNNLSDVVESANLEFKSHSAADILKVPKHPFQSIISGNLPMAFQQYPFCIPSFNAMSPVASNLGRSLLEFQESIRHGNLQLPSGPSLVTPPANGSFLTNPWWQVIATQAARQQETNRAPIVEKTSPENEARAEKERVGLSTDDDEVQHFTMRNSVLQHPDTWLQKPKNSVFGLSREDGNSNSYDLNSTQQTDIGSDDDSVILDVDSKPNRGEEEESNLVIDDDPENECEEDDDEEDEEEEDEENQSRERNATDLASVTTLLSKASTHNFTFLRDEERDEEEPHTGDEDDDSSGMISPDCKKSSAYSSAPQKQKCPYCDRKFPWSSSLVRHIRTHTGQKPYLCEVCNYPFTTKSNCDRHLLRKHPDSIQALTGYRPYRCARCPNTAFSSNEALRKHEMIKHNRSPPKDGYAKYDTSHLPAASDSSSSRESVSPATDMISYTFQCFVCDAALPSPQSSALLHVSECHPEVYRELVLPELPSSLTQQKEKDDASVSTHADKIHCLLCFRRLSSLAALKSHVSEDHARLQSTPPTTPTAQHPLTSPNSSLSTSAIVTQSIPLAHSSLILTSNLTLSSSCVTLTPTSVSVTHSNPSASPTPVTLTPNISPNITFLPVSHCTPKCTTPSDIAAQISITPAPTEVPPHGTPSESEGAEGGSHAHLTNRTSSSVLDTIIKAQSDASKLLGVR